MRPKFEACFIDLGPGRSGRRFALWHAPPDGAHRGSVVYVPPFAEEMNKSRRMAAVTSRRLAAAGFAVLCPDLLGCGDSPGDFGDATWAQWVDDVAACAAWIEGRYPGPVWLWGLRAGALLACQAWRRLRRPAGLILWQPTPSGRQVLQGFLRLKAAAQLADGGGKAIVEGLRRSLAAGEPVEIAGYRLAPALALDLERAALTPPPDGSPGRLLWFETSMRDPQAVLPASLAVIRDWQAAGWQVDVAVVHGPAFWQTTEIEEAPELVDATAARLIGVVAA